ncbi:hypothetical protein [Micromonospora matsumotoense]|uniref:hypothetical protein n=1 Tax=Micromonospora matsumotoense TaxID=121616 RepID=UPI00114CF8C8|nr:hypothetical protein [Micromonospora matsumotoense]
MNVELTCARHGPPENLRVHLAGYATINRGIWCVNWNAVTVALVHKHVTIEFDTVAIRTPDRPRSRCGYEKTPRQSSTRVTERSRLGAWRRPASCRARSSANLRITG